MNEFSKLDPHVRSLALVGGYLQHWAVMEHALNNAIGKALGLDPLTTLVVSKNIQIRDKIKILRTSLDGAFIHPPKKREHMKSVVQKVGNLAPTRNMIAHDMFVATEDGDGVTFFVTKAAGKLEIKDKIWSQLEFKSQYQALDDITEELISVEEALTAAASLKALNDEIQSRPNGLLEPLGSISSLYHQLPEPHNFDPASEQTVGETTQASDQSPQTAE